MSDQLKDTKEPAATTPPRAEEPATEQSCQSDTTSSQLPLIGDGCGGADQTCCRQATDRPAEEPRPDRFRRLKRSLGRAVENTAAVLAHIDEERPATRIACGAVSAGLGTLVGISRRHPAKLPVLASFAISLLASYGFYRSLEDGAMVVSSRSFNLLLSNRGWSRTDIYGPHYKPDMD